MSADPAPAPLRHRSVVARGSGGQPRTYRLSSQPLQQAAYRRLALTILGLDVAALVHELRAAHGIPQALQHAARAA